jgi:hypothetical protein
MAQTRDLGRFLPPPTPRERAVRWLPADLPARIGPVQLQPFGAKWVAVRCPSEFDRLMRSTSGLREAGSHRCLISRQRMGPRELRRTTDPLFRQAGIDLDGEGTR